MPAGLQQLWLRVAVIAAFLLEAAAAGTRGSDAAPLSPTALAASKDCKTLFVACATGNRVLCLDLAQRKLTRSFPLPDPPSGLALSPDGSLLYVTCAAPEGKVCVVDLAEGSFSKTLAVGHTAMAPVVSLDGRTLFVCNRFNNDVSVLDLTTGKERRRIPVVREPVAADLTHDGKHLLVANLLHAGRADAACVAASVSVIDVLAGTVAKQIQLPDGSGSLNDLRVSPDGKYAVVTHLLSRFRLPATQVDRGWMNSNAATILDLSTMEVLDTVLLDSVDQGAANPWGVGWSQDGRTLVIAHAGTHEVSVIDFPALLAKLVKVRPAQAGSRTAEEKPAPGAGTGVRNDLAFLLDGRRRVKFPETDLGPRAIAVAGDKVYAANYFSDSLSVIDLAAPGSAVESIALGNKAEMSQVRKGEFYFHDAALCFQHWQSCSSCHPGQARVDGMNWDLLNDGIGNPKNVKSLLLAHQTPPAMSMGVRETAEMAVRAGIRHILFTVQPEEVATSIDAYLKSLKPVPSPYLVKGRLSEQARRGEKLFKDKRVGCAACHPPGLFTDLKTYDVGTRGSFDQPHDKFDTPTLVECWRTAPYLHDGSAAALTDVLTTHNPHDQHGKTSHLTAQQIEDLAAYVLSL